MREFPASFRWCLTVPLLACTVLIGGCGGVQFEGRIFEAVGLTNEPEREEKKVAERAPLVLPPKRELPPPGPSPQADKPQNWPQDPNEIQKQAALAKKRKKPCGQQDFTKKTSVDQIETLTDPLKTCENNLIGKPLDVNDEARADGSPDTLLEGPNEVSTRKEPPSPWRTDSTQ